jgi:hypothetical protein
MRDRMHQEYPGSKRTPLKENPNLRNPASAARR